jgi:hypothetical protein
MKTTSTLLVIGWLLIAAPATQALPVITLQPTNLSVSLGASASFRVSATSTNSPIGYQWTFARTNLALTTNSVLTLNDVQITNAGSYTVVLTDSSGSVTSQVAQLEVDSAFTKITAGRIASDIGRWVSCSWGDYDGDGFLDLFVAQNGLNALYHNNRDGTFTRVTTGTELTISDGWICPAWADFDNDGHLDLLLLRGDQNGFPNQLALFRNNGDGTFTALPSSIFHGPSDPGGGSPGAAWADYDRDGFVDLYITRSVGGSDWLLHNNGDGTFTRDLSIPPDNLQSFGSTWADYNNDGWPDLFVGNFANSSTILGTAPTALYENTGGTFTRVLTGNIVTQSFGTCLWADYDNDGYLDALSGHSHGNLLIFHNNGDGTFTSQTSQQLGPIASEVGTNWVSANWGDYDNDGFVDLFLTGGGYNPNSTPPPGPNFLYHNNGDGSFTRVTSGSLANDLGNGSGCVWGDYDNDGFLDLFVARGAFGASAESNLLYRNNGNSNAWIKVRLVGTSSNRSAIGAKVRVKATIRGNAMWQMREIGTGGDCNLSGGLLEAHFGLGNATNIDQMRIEWPSGIVQTITNVAPRQILTVIEHQTTPVAPFTLSGSLVATNRTVALTVTGNPGMLYVFEASTNLTSWTKIGVRSNATGTVTFVDAGATGLSRRFYRASAP